MIGDWELEAMTARFRKWAFRRDGSDLVASRDGFPDIRQRSPQLLEAGMAKALHEHQVDEARTPVPGLGYDRPRNRLA
jgi:hypothetical protein